MRETPTYDSRKAAIRSKAKEQSKRNKASLTTFLKLGLRNGSTKTALEITPPAIAANKKPPNSGIIYNEKTPKRSRP